MVSSASPSRQLLPVLTGIGLAALSANAAEGFSLDEAGARAGISSNGSANRFLQMEAFTKWDLFKPVYLGNEVALTFQLDASAGWLGGRGAEGFVGVLGPAARIGKVDFPLSFLGGIAPTILSTDTYGDKDFGIPLQFTSYLGFEARIWSHATIGYRYQHMSNGGLSSHNPGLNLHMFSLGYSF